jgi:HAD superfamily hydrolase (TIGR01509 family)
MPIEVIFFDVGGTLLFPDHEKTLIPLWNRGVRPTGAQLLVAERAARQEMDQLVSKTAKVDLSYWDTYYSRLLGELGLDDTALHGELVRLVRTSANWSRMRPGTFEVLASLKRKYRLAVISNSDGHMGERLASLGFGPYFQHVTDSGNVGHEKPAPQIFQAALSAMSVQADRALYLGDIYAIDYLGAQNAGMKPVLMDIAAVYSQTDLPRIDSLSELEPCLKKFV